MRKIHLLIASISCIGLLNSCSVSKNGILQEIQLDIHNSSISKLLETENILKSKKFKTNVDYVSFSGDAQPIIFRRKEKDLPDLLVFYYFKSKDSLMSKISYEWDIKNFNNENNNPQKEKIQKAFINKFKQLEKIIEKKYSTGKATGSIENFNDIKTEKGLEKKIIWKPNDSTEIELFMSLSNYYKMSKYGGIPTRHRVSLNIKKPEKEKLPQKLEKEKIEKLNNIVKEFMNSLKNEKFDNAKSYLSDKIRSTVSIEVLKQLSKQMDLTRELEITFTGVQMLMTGETYNWLDYKYSNETPIITKIKFIFDNNDKILGVKPMKKLTKINKK